MPFVDSNQVDSENINTSNTLNIQNTPSSLEIKSKLPEPGYSRRTFRKRINSTQSYSSPAKNLDNLLKEKTYKFDIDIEELYKSYSIEQINKLIKENNLTQEEMKEALKKTKPKQRITGYAKEYLNMETKRLAEAIKENSKNMNNLVESLEGNEIKYIKMTKGLGEKVIIKHEENIKLVGEKNILLKEVEEYKCQMEEEKIEIERLRETEVCLNAEVEKMKLENMRIGKEKEDIKRESEETKKEGIKEIENMKQEFEQKRKNKEKEIKELSDKIEQKEKLLKEKEETLSREKETNLKLTLEKQGLEGKLEFTNEKFEEEKKRVVKVEEELKESRKQVVEFISKLESSNIEVSEMKQNLAAEKAMKESDVKNLLNRLEEVKEENEKYKKEKNKNETEYKDIIQQKEKEFDELRNNSSNKQEELEKNLELLTQELKSEKETFEESMKKIVEEKNILSEKNGCLEEEVSNLQDEVQAVRKTSEEILKKKEAEQLYKLNIEIEGMQRKLIEFDNFKVLYKELEDKLFDAEREKRELRNEIQNLKGTVRVIARVKPKNIEEKDKLEVGSDERSLKLFVESDSNSGRISKPYLFKFNHVFNQKSTQTEVFDEVASFIQSALDGYNVCLFSYGQTGSGKTFTMTGDKRSEEYAGIIPRSTEHIMKYKQQLEKMGWSFRLQATFLEIYNENIQDLLARASQEKKKCEVRESKKEIIVTNVVKEDIRSVEDVYKLLVKAENRRKVEKTDMNERSSRSHSVFTIFITGTHERKGSKLKGSLSLCDLAGSERLKKSNVTGARLRETQNINKSLSALSDVFLALNKQGIMRAKKKEESFMDSSLSMINNQPSLHIPYRNSKLTQILRPCFAGEGKILMIVNISSENRDVDETFCSLRFAKQVNQTQVGRAQKNLESLEDEGKSNNSSIPRFNRR
eukprot:snap_masked-scaffold_46-processed-gene-1.70-mRNA-1 protein AED:0.42 eAED:0.42 QI:0/-1/0/1/-1/1/1/0/921